MKTTTIMQSLKTAILATIIGLGAAYALAWVGPTQAPPLANVPGPINKGTADQVVSNVIFLKGKTGTEGLVLKGMFMSVDGVFETGGDTRLAMDPNAKVGIGTTNPQSTLDVNGSITTDGNDGNINMGGNLITGGTNSWIFHTPDDGRTDLYIAPETNGAWDWGNELKIDNQGNMTVNGDVEMGGNITMNGKTVVGHNFLFKETKTLIGGTGIVIPPLNNNPGWQLMKLWNLNMTVLSDQAVSISFTSANWCNNGEIKYRLSIDSKVQDVNSFFCNNSARNVGTFNFTIPPGDYHSARLDVDGNNVTGGTFDLNPWNVYRYGGYN